MAKITVLGSGMVGSAMAIDLVKRHEVLLADINENALLKTKKRAENLQIKTADLKQYEELKDVVESADLVVGAVPGFMGYELLSNLIKLKKNTVDISFCPENAMELNDRAIEAGISIYVDAGVAPGLSNLVLGRYNSLLKLDSFKCMVGGLPLEPQAPWNYKAPFSPIDVIEEYTRPARFIRDGRMVTMDALTEIEEVNIDGIKLEAFNSDGLRTLLDTMSHVPNVVEKTLRYPGHAKDILLLRKAGFFSPENQEVGDVSVKPIDLSARILIDAWKLAPEEPEFTVMTMEMKGQNLQSGVDETVFLHLYDEYDPESKTSSMARTTGYTACALAEYMLQKPQDQPKGIIPLEILGKKEEAFQFVLEFLSKRNIKIQHK